jgi:hypothetical protein
MVPPVVHLVVFVHVVTFSSFDVVVLWTLLVTVVVVSIVVHHHLVPPLCACSQCLCALSCFIKLDAVVLCTVCGDTVSVVYHFASMFGVANLCM